MRTTVLDYSFLTGSYNSIALRSQQLTVLIFVFYLLLVFTFYIFTSQGDRTYRRVRYNDPAVDNLLEIVSNEL